MANRRLPLVVLILLAPALAGCAAPEVEPVAPSAPAAVFEEVRPPAVPPVPVERIVVGGTGIGTDALTIAGAAFEATHPTRAVTVQPPVGSGGGIKAVLQQQYDLSISARAPKDSEPGLTFTPLYKDAVVFVVNDAAGVSTLSVAQIQGIFRGEFTNWNELGGNDLPIRLYSREADDSITKKYMAAWPALHNSSWSGAVNLLNDDITMYGVIGNTAGAAGFTVRHPMFLREANVRFLTPDGVDASSEALLSGAYPAALAVGIVAPIELTGAAQEFHAWLTGAEGKAALREAGFSTV